MLLSAVAHLRVVVFRRVASCPFAFFSFLIFFFIVVAVLLRPCLGDAAAVRRDGRSRRNRDGWSQRRGVVGVGRGRKRCQVGGIVVGPKVLVGAAVGAVMTPIHLRQKASTRRGQQLVESFLQEVKYVSAVHSWESC